MLFDGTELYQQAHDISASAHRCVSDMPKLGQDEAEKHARYDAIRASVMLDLMAGDVEVVVNGQRRYIEKPLPATVTKTIADGTKQVGEAFVIWKCAEAVKDANAERELLDKKDMGFVQDALNRLWAEARNGN